MRVKNGGTLSLNPGAVANRKKFAAAIAFWPGRARFPAWKNSPTSNVRSAARRLKWSWTRASPASGSRPTVKSAAVDLAVLVDGDDRDSGRETSHGLAEIARANAHRCSKSLPKSLPESIRLGFALLCRRGFTRVSRRSSTQERQQRLRRCRCPHLPLAHDLLGAELLPIKGLVSAIVGPH